MLVLVGVIPFVKGVKSFNEKMKLVRCSGMQWVGDALCDFLFSSIFAFFLQQDNPGSISSKPKTLEWFWKNAQVVEPLTFIQKLISNAVIETSWADCMKVPLFLRLHSAILIQQNKVHVQCTVIVEVIQHAVFDVTLEWLYHHYPLFYSIPSHCKA